MVVIVAFVPEGLKPGAQHLARFGDLLDRHAVAANLDTAIPARRVRVRQLAQPPAAGVAVLDPGGHGLTAGQIVRRLEDDRVAAEKNERAPHHATLLDALDELRDKQGRLSAQRLGTRLHLLREKRKGGAWITEAERESRSGSPRWVVRRSAGVAGAKPTQREGEKGEEQADHTHDHAPARARETAGNSPASPASPANGDGATVATASDWLAPGPEVPTAAAPVWAADEDSGE